MRICKLINNNVNFKSLSVKAGIKAEREFGNDRKSKGLLLDYAKQAARNNIHVDYQDGYYRVCKGESKIGINQEGNYYKMTTFTPLNNEKYKNIYDAINNAEILSILRPELAKLSSDILNYTI